MPKNKNKKRVFGFSPLFEGFRLAYTLLKGKKYVQSGSTIAESASGEIVAHKPKFEFAIGEGKKMETTKKAWIDPAFYLVGVELGMLDRTFVKILRKCIESEEDWIEFEIDQKEKNKEYEVLKKLIAAKVLVRDKNQKIYWLNPRFFGAYNRINKLEQYQMHAMSEAKSAIEKIAKITEIDEKQAKTS